MCSFLLPELINNTSMDRGGIHRRTEATPGRLGPWTRLLGVGNQRSEQTWGTVRTRAFPARAVVGRHFASSCLLD